MQQWVDQEVVTASLPDSLDARAASYNDIRHAILYRLLCIKRALGSISNRDPLGISSDSSLSTSGYSTCTDDKVWQWRKELEGQLQSLHKETDKLRRFDYYIFPPTIWNRIGLDATAVYLYRQIYALIASNNPVCRNVIKIRLATCLSLRMSTVFCCARKAPKWPIQHWEACEGVTDKLGYLFCPSVTCPFGTIYEEKEELRSHFYRDHYHVHNRKTWENCPFQCGQLLLNCGQPLLNNCQPCPKSESMEHFLNHTVSHITNISFNVQRAFLFRSEIAPPHCNHQAPQLWWQRNPASYTAVLCESCVWLDGR